MYIRKGIIKGDDWSIALCGLPWPTKLRNFVSLGSLCYLERLLLKVRILLTFWCVVRHHKMTRPRWQRVGILIAPPSKTNEPTPLLTLGAEQCQGFLYASLSFPWNHLDSSSGLWPVAYWLLVCFLTPLKKIETTLSHKCRSWNYFSQQSRSET